MLRKMMRQDSCGGQHICCPYKIAEAFAVFPRGCVRCVEKPPLCKGRWLKAGGIVRLNSLILCDEQSLSHFVTSLCTREPFPGKG